MSFRVLVFVCLIFGMTEVTKSDPVYPVVINTWPFTAATQAAWSQVISGVNAVDAVVAGCTQCERDRCDGTVGAGGSPNELGETTLDALIIDGLTMDSGAVACLKNIKNAIAVAKEVMLHTTHTLLVGEDATNFAVQMGFQKEDLHSDESREMWVKWKANKCQPNYWTAVRPDHSSHCGPYEPAQVSYLNQTHASILDRGHDTIGMIVIDQFQNIAAGTSTNGLKFKIPGRVGDSPIPGSGASVDNYVGAAVATGDGDILMRFSPSHQAVEYLRNGYTPQLAAEETLRRIAKYFPSVSAGLVVVSQYGDYGAAAIGFSNFTLSMIHKGMSSPIIQHVEPLKLS